MKIGQGYKIGASLLLNGFIFNFLETWYFGWNISPMKNGVSQRNIIKSYA